MKDPRLDILADYLLNKSLELTRGQGFRLVSGHSANPLNKAILRSAARNGLYPDVKLRDDELTRLYFSCFDGSDVGCFDKYLDDQIASEYKRWEKLDGYVVIGIDDNDSELASIDPAVLKHVRSKQHDLNEYEINQKKWVFLYWPTMADAQKAGMSYDDFYEFFIRSAIVDYDEMKRSIQPLVNKMKQTDYVRLVGPGTDISFSIKDQAVIPCTGACNIPDGEVYTAPVRESANGVVQYNTVFLYLGKKYINPRLVFKNGKIIEASCDNDTDGLNILLDLDEGARYLGEFAIGVNNAITKSIGNTLYDEKIGGSFHLTPGSCYDDCPNGNKSQVHLDMVCIQKEEYGAVRSGLTAKSYEKMDCS